MQGEVKPFLVGHWSLYLFLPLQVEGPANLIIDKLQSLKKAATIRRPIDHDRKCQGNTSERERWRVSLSCATSRKLFVGELLRF
jgi:hypothetical protein